MSSPGNIMQKWLQQGVLGILCCIVHGKNCMQLSETL